MSIKSCFIVLLTSGLLMFVPVAVISGTNSPLSLESTAKAESVQAKTPGQEIDKPRGQLLYENHCGGCHQTSVHGRDPRKADSISKIKYWINVWQKELELNWSEAEIKDVTSYINDKYYQFSK